jgi:hypothetical protein
VRPVPGAKQIFFVKRPARGVVDYAGDFWDKQDASDDGTASYVMSLCCINGGMSDDCCCVVI